MILKRILKNNMGGCGMDCASVAACFERGNETV